MEKREFKDRVYSLMANMIKALANPHRLEIIDLLGPGERSVESIATEGHLSIANASQHLQVLKSSNLVAIRREGNFVYYRLANDEIYKAFQILRKLGTSQVAEMEKVIRDFRVQRNSFESLSFEELLMGMKSKLVVLIDVRPVNEYRNGHIPGALNIPVNELAIKMKKLPKNKEYIVYCRGSFCVFADEAVKLLLEKGYHAKRLEEGFSDWKVSGQPVAEPLEC